ncbi:cytochrome P450 11B, mitochondrial [Syngnathoides biaculeatus]|uniref:cytochrome P450 11B, mitochondrial n=1 Tax=Syngnathoides biaculeatus TaxID=300417 RepID=UPI002ADE51B8|nr:cytochrome P450 11B, mitochondrial [Syngnathoides biaculeatus]XP_061675638.1 cytochrome P450 11B, mitochondrial [Syngnathoides biaculeatus]
MSNAVRMCVRVRLSGVAGSRALSVMVGGKGAENVSETNSRGRVRSFEEIPNTGRNRWLNLVTFWREGRFRLLHKHMESSFNALGPIYRENLGPQSTVNIMLPCDIAELFRYEGLTPQRMVLEPWAKHREIRGHEKGVFLKNGAEWRADRLLLNKEVMLNAAVKRFLPDMDEVARDFCQMIKGRVEAQGRGKQGESSLTFNPGPDIFAFALEASCYILYGERIGLFSSKPPMESQKFIWAVERMLTTTVPLLYLPSPLLVYIGTSLWNQHATAWDHIFSHAEARMKRGFQRLSSGPAPSSDAGKSSGVLGKLLEKGQLSGEAIKANITELMAGAVDTTAVPLQFALFELARNPAVQESIRRQVKESVGQAGGDPQKALDGAPLLKGTVKEILRLYPVGITVQRYPVQDIVLQNYNIPAGSLVQVCLYPMGRSAEVFDDPLNFDPGRWARMREDGTQGKGTFRSLAFGFGSRQCIGRRIAENEIQLFLMHILLNFHLSVSSAKDIDTKFAFILQPESPPRITFTML